MAKSREGVLTTNQGTAISDNQNSLRAGVRGPTHARGLHLPREDHALRPRAHSRADRPRARLGRARLLPAVQVLVEADARGVSPGSESADAGLRPLLHRRRRRRLRRYAPRRARLRGEVLHRGRQLRPRREQHPGLLHPGRDQVPRPRSLGEDGARPWVSAGGERARHVLGLHLADAREPAHDPLGDVRPDTAAIAADDGGLRRSHVSLRQCRPARRPL